MRKNHTGLREQSGARSEVVNEIQRGIDWVLA